MPGTAPGERSASGCWTWCRCFRGWTLLPLWEAPRAEYVTTDLRLQVHLLASVCGWADYTAEFSKVELLDEYADSSADLDLIVTLLKEGRDAAAIRAVFGVERPMASGML